jgi:hypothetical protein
MSDNTKALFLSYASQDAATVQHIADGLRAEGIEVWFDQSELRGGDAWDALIRKRIKGCALFMPIVSRTTDARTEGYFRLEWKLAVDRSHLMSEDRAFIVPVVIDDTDQETAHVPEAFRARQWSRLTNGEVTADFVRQIRHLIDIPVVDTPLALSPRVASAAPAAAPPQTPAPVTSPSPFPWRIAGIVGGTGAVVVAAFALMKSPADVQPTTTAPSASFAAKPASTAQATSTAATAVPPQTAVEPAHVDTDNRSGSHAAERRTARAVPAVLNTSKTPRGDNAQAPVADDTAQPLRIVQGTPFAPIEEPKNWEQWGVRVELSFWETIKTSTMLEDYEEYLRQYPTGRFAGLARNRVKALKAKR